MPKLCQHPWPSPGILVDRFCYPVRGLFSVDVSKSRVPLRTLQCLAVSPGCLPLSASPWAIKTQQDHTSNECEGSWHGCRARRRIGDTPGPPKKTRSSPEDTDGVASDLFEHIDAPQATKEQSTLEDGISHAVGQRKGWVLSYD